MKRTTTFLAVLLIAFGMCSMAHAEYDGTPVTPQQITKLNYFEYGLTASNYEQYLDYYGIRNAAELYGFADLVNNPSNSWVTYFSNALLTADIVVNENCKATIASGGVPTYKWAPIGSKGRTFSGTFDGNGHTISGLYYDNAGSTSAFAYSSSDNFSGGYNIGFIGNAGGDTIKNVAVVDSYFKAYQYCGAVVGNLLHGLVENCFADAEIVATSYSAGVVGYPGYSSVINCGNIGHVSGSLRIGGVVGYMGSGTLSGCYSTNTIDGTTEVGVIAGYLAGSIDASRNYYVQGTRTKGAGNVATDATERTQVKTAAQFASGEVCWLLNGATNDGPFAWHQTLGSDTIPVLFAGGDVYANGSFNCAGVAQSEITYTNGSGTVTYAEHNHVDGVCTVCGHVVEDWLSPNAEGWFEINDAAKLYWFAAYVNAGHSDANAKLTANIVVNTDVLKADSTLNSGDFRSWTPIGVSGKEYAGTFDGQDNTVSGLYFDNHAAFPYPQGGMYVGLFGKTKGAIVKNVGLINSYMYGYQNVGGITGYAEKGRIQNCFNSSTIMSDGYLGGVAGYLTYDTLMYCHNTGKVQMRNYGYYIGGVLGIVEYSYISHSYNAAPVLGMQANSNVGGVAGALWGNSKMIACYNLGDVSGRNVAVGGVTGQMIGDTVSSCFNYGQVLSTYSTNDVGGVVGVDKYGSSLIEKCAYLAHSARIYSGGQYTERGGVGAADTEGAVAYADSLFRSGAVTYALNGSTSEGDLAWFQTLGVDTIPQFDGDTVYLVGSCVGATYSNVKISGSGHSLVYSDSVPATCTEAGHVAGWTCSLCHKHYADSLATEEISKWSIPALGHKWVEDPEVLPTCTEVGLTYGSHCERCHLQGVVPDTIPALGHQFTNYVYNDDATTLADGTETAHCDHAGCSETNTRVAEGTRLTDVTSTAEIDAEKGTLVYAHHHTIVVENVSGRIYVYDMNGRCLVVSDDAINHVRTEIEMSAHGVYVVRCGGQTTKVVVK